MEIVISIPYIHGVTDSLGHMQEIDFYQAVSIPELQGGKEPRVVGNTVLSIESASHLIEKYGSRFRVLANTCFPRWTSDVERICDILNTNDGSIVVSRIEFAREIRERYPRIKLVSSVIMNFYEDIDKIISSGLFDVVGGSQFYNDNTDLMISSIHKIHRRIVMYLLLGCVWSRGCIRHYELPSLQWANPDMKEVFSDKECTGRPGFNVEFEKLLGAGFKRFKFGYRTPTKEQAEETIYSYIERYWAWKTR